MDTNNGIIFYEQGTEAWGDGHQVLFAPAPPPEADVDSDDAIWEYMDTARSVSVADIVEVLRSVEQTAEVRALLDVLDA